ncbi:hypothetical protein INP51_05185 [Blautia liquoris]|uniref:Beta-glucuronidase n=1 Tax=Blautia liquoris TaxID=2779518 RepID=A0A7M2RLS6_9FIRM|nr:hypothetical protein INP51_05185 [Blautia liquoris]
MIRTFSTNNIRKTTELSDSLWQFSPCSGERKGENIEISVPCCWETIPGFESYRGEGIFTKKFHAGGNVRMMFKGVSHTAIVSVDGRMIGEHYNAYTPFSCVFKGMEEGEHELSVRASNSFSEESALHVPNDYMSYGGITRGVVMEMVREEYIDWIHVIPKKESGGWNAEVYAKVVNLSDINRKIKLNLVIDGGFHDSKEVVFDEFGEAVVHVDFHIRDKDVKVWDIINPNLCGIRAELSDEDGIFDDLNDRFGFREIQISGKNILLNGRKLRIKGICRHEDHPMFGCALPFAAMQQDIQMLKDLGANSIRTSHYPNDELFLDLCDEQGILVWEENHARGLSVEQMLNPRFESQAEACIREMITAHMNHPSIYIWGILNECASDTKYGYQCYKKQYDLIKELDPSRPRSSASCKFKTDLCFGLPEVVSYNLYPEWYHDTPSREYVDEIYNWVQQESDGSGKPFLVTEIGAGAIYGFRSQTLCKWSEEYQRIALEHQMKAVLDQEGCSGIYIWQYCDVRISGEWFSSRPRTMNNKGVVDEYRRPKLAYDKVREILHSYSDYR